MHYKNGKEEFINSFRMRTKYFVEGKQKKEKQIKALWLYNRAEE